MGNVEVHDLSPVRADERKELNLSRKVTYKQYCKHVNGTHHEECLQELPWNIRDSISLYERMTVAFNALTELPPEIPLRLPHLNYLDLSHNQLVMLPESFGLLFHLRTLILRNNKLREVPKAFVHLVKLEKVDLSNNVLKILPPDIGKMEALTKLNVAGNKLKNLPLSLGGSKTLTVIIANDNRLQDPPMSIACHGSEAILTYLKKNYKLGGHPVEPSPAMQRNVFPRVRGNQLHSSVANPHSAQVQYIQTQTQTANTPSRVKTPLLPPSGATTLDADVLRDRIIGLIYGAAIGDAVGLATRCMSADECSFHYGKDNIQYEELVQDEHRVRWRVGDWTSNFDTMMLVLECILSWAGVVDELDFAKRLHMWVHKGFPELGDSEGIVLSKTTKKVCEETDFLRSPHTAARRVLQEYVPIQENGHPPSDDERSSLSSEVSVSSANSERFRLNRLNSTASYSCTDCQMFGMDNGALVQTAVLGIPYFHSLTEVEENTVRICKTTHADPRCVASSVVIATIVALMLQGKHDLNCYKTVDEMIHKATEAGRKHLCDKDQVEELLTHCKITDIVSVNISESGNTGHTLKTMTCGLVALRSQVSYKSFLMKLIMQGGDSNSNGCVAGALLGCKTGFSHLPQDWVTGLRKKQTTWLNNKVNLLLDMIGLP